MFLSGAVGRTVLAAGTGAITLDLDRTVFLQMALFVTLVALLKPLLLDPLLRLFALREAHTEGAKARARDLQERAGILLRRYERELVRIHQIAAEERERMRAETAQLEGEILRHAREATAKIVADGRRRIESEVNGIRFELGRQSERVAQDVVGAVMGRKAE
jgi:F-type H+-transporting ATPase subunit b